MALLGGVNAIPNSQTMRPYEKVKFEALEPILGRPGLGMVCEIAYQFPYPILPAGDEDRERPDLWPVCCDVSSVLFL